MRRSMKTSSAAFTIRAASVIVYARRLLAADNGDLNWHPNSVAPSDDMLNVISKQRRANAGRQCAYGPEAATFVAARAPVAEAAM
jgi:hypothetical protein